MSKKTTKNPEGVTELTAEELDGVAGSGSGGIRSTGGRDKPKVLPPSPRIKAEGKNPAGIAGPPDIPRR